MPALLFLELVLAATGLLLINLVRRCWSSASG